MAYLKNKIDIMAAFLLFCFVSTLFSLLYGQNVIDVIKFGADVKGVKKSTDAIKKSNR